MAQDIVFWSGPVAPFQVPGATVPGAVDVFMGCRGDKGPHPWCPDIGEQLRHDPAGLLAAAGQDSFGELFLGAFSAGGSVVKRLLEEPEWRQRVTAVHLADAVWTSGVMPPPAIEGFVRYGVDVATGSGDKLFIASSSPIANKQWATGHQNLDAIRAEIESRTGLTFEQRGPSAPFSGATIYQLGNVLLVYMPLEPYGHGHTEFAPQVWQQIIVPWLDKGKGPVGDPGGLEPPIPPTGPPPPVEVPPTPPAGGMSARQALAFGGGFLLGSLAVWRVFS